MYELLADDSHAVRHAVAELVAAMLDEQGAAVLAAAPPPSAGKKGGRGRRRSGEGAEAASEAERQLAGLLQVRLRCAAGPPGCPRTGSPLDAHINRLPIHLFKPLRLPTSQVLHLLANPPPEGEDAEAAAEQEREVYPLDQEVVAQVVDALFQRWVGCAGVADQVLVGRGRRGRGRTWVGSAGSAGQGGVWAAQGRVPGAGAGAVAQMSSAGQRPPYGASLAALRCCCTLSTSPPVRRFHPPAFPCSVPALSDWPLLLRWASQGSAEAHFGDAGLTNLLHLLRDALRKATGAALPGGPADRKAGGREKQQAQVRAAQCGCIGRPPSFALPAPPTTC